MNGCGTIHWSPANLSGIMSLKKRDFPPPNRLPNSSSWIHAEVLDAFISKDPWSFNFWNPITKLIEMTHVFWFFFVSRIDIFKYVIYGIAAAFFVYGILLMVEGFFTTGAIKDLYGDFKITTCGRCVSAWVCNFSALSMKCGLISTAQRCLYSPAEIAEAFFNVVTFSSYIFKIKFLN